MSNQSERRFLVSVAALVLGVVGSGCSVGPDYQSPEISMPAAWSYAEQKTTGSTPQSQVVPTAWWTLFNDSHLSSLVERGMAANFDLVQAEARIRQARASSRVARAGYYPQVTGGLDYQRSERGFEVSSTTDELFALGFDAIWELDIFGGTRRRVESSDALLQATVEDFRAVATSLQAEIATRYITIRGLQREHQVALANLETQRTSARISSARFEAGFASRFDVASAEAEIASTEAQIPLILSQLSQEMLALGVLLGFQPGVIDQELTAPLPIPMVGASSNLGLPSQLLQRRADIRLAEAQLHAATAQIGVATAQLYPSFSLRAFFGIDGETFGSLAEWQNRSWSLAGSALAPLFEGGRIRAEIAFETAAQEEALARYQHTILIALQEVEGALVAISAEQRRLRSLATAVDANTVALASARELYRSGLTEFVTVLSAERSLFASELQLVQSSRNMGLHTVRLFKSLGGGWEDLAPIP